MHSSSRLLLIMGLLFPSFAGCTKNSEKPEMVHIEAGEFWMGCDENTDKECLDIEKPGRLINLAAFSIDRSEVTTKAYKSCVEAGGCSEPQSGMLLNWNNPARDDHPINGVTWSQAKAYCKWAGKRLPSEAEWEKAARGTDRRLYPWGDQKPDCSRAVISEGRNNAGCGSRTTSPVCSKPEGHSPYGLCDMGGNVSEWVEDTWSLYGKEADTQLQGFRIRRGDSYESSPGKYSRLSFRLQTTAESAARYGGFRCAK